MERSTPKKAVSIRKPPNEEAASILKDEDVQQVLAIVGDCCSITSDERRASDRFPLFCCMELTPVHPNGGWLRDETTTVVGKDLSANGISFSHDLPISSRRIILTLTHPELGRFSLEADVAWSRKTPIGLYESGCRLIRKITSLSETL